MEILQDWTFLFLVTYDSKSLVLFEATTVAIISNVDPPKTSKDVLLQRWCGERQG